jgi:iron complex outermembrane receptor protein
VNAVVTVPSPVTGLNQSLCANPNPPPATGPCTQDWSGLRIQRSPDWTATLGADYTIPLAMGGSVVASANISYQSFFLPARSDRALNGRPGYRFPQPATAQLNLQAAWNSPDERWRVTAYGNNVTNTHLAYTRSASSFGDTKIYGWPRTYGVKVDFNF